MIGPLVGGLFAGADQILGITGWRWVFLINVPVGLVALGMVFVFLHLPSFGHASTRFDWWGATLIVATLAPLLLVAEQGREWGWTSAPSVACYAVGLVGLVALILVERAMGADAIIPLASAEVTVEANPGTVLGRDYLRGLRALGVNRLSMGVQSLHDPTLRVLGRIHTAAEARESYADARRAGFDNINLDFMFGLPGQDAAQWDATLREIVTWGAEHFSLYSLILEESTPLFAQVTAGRTSVPDDDATGEMYERAIELLGAGGYAQYEISNWARARGMGDGESGRGKLSPTPNPQLPSPTSLYACHHNLAYWLNADYLAAGAGAHGHVFPQRYADVLGIDEYVARVAAGRMPVAEISELGARDLYAETMFMGLRLNVGVSYAHFRERCGAELPAIYPAELADLEARGLLVRDALGVRLSARGRMLGNQVFEAFV